MYLKTIEEAIPFVKNNYTNQEQIKKMNLMQENIQKFKKKYFDKEEMDYYEKLKVPG